MQYLDLVYRSLKFFLFGNRTSDDQEVLYGHREGSWTAWWEALEESIKEAAEKRNTIEQGSLHEGVPAILVIVDGGWSKRSHKDSYNAK